MFGSEFSKDTSRLLQFCVFFFLKMFYFTKRIAISVSQYMVMIVGKLLRSVFFSAIVIVMLRSLYILLVYGRTFRIIDDASAIDNRPH